jgi:hypothetical protein
MVEQGSRGYVDKKGKLRAKGGGVKREGSYTELSVISEARLQGQDDAGPAKTT